MESFKHVQDWLNEVHKVTGSSITKLIIGNKNDLNHQRQVNFQQAQQYALSVGASIIETSAKTANNVDKSFTMIAKELVKLIPCGVVNNIISGFNDFICFPHSFIPLCNL